MDEPLVDSVLPRIVPAATATATTGTLVPPPLQSSLTATSQHTFPSYDSLRTFLDSYARARGFEIRWPTTGSEYSADHGGKATCWCRPEHDNSKQPSTDDESVLSSTAGAAADGVQLTVVGVGKKRRRRNLTRDAEQVFNGCHWYVNFNRLTCDAATPVYIITTRNLTHNGDQHTEHDEQPISASTRGQQPADDAADLRSLLAVVVEAGVREVLNEKAEDRSVAADEKLLLRAVQLDKKRDGRLVCYAAKQCAAAISRQQQHQHASEQKDDSAMTDVLSPPPRAVSAEQLAEAMVVTIRARLAADEQLANMVDVSAAEGFINITLQTATPASSGSTAASPQPSSSSSSIITFPTFPLPAHHASSHSSTPPLPPSYLFPSIGTFHSIYNEKYGTPRQGSVTPHSRGRLILHHHVDTQSLLGLRDYSHVWLLFIFHLNTNTAVRAKVRPPRLGAKVGVFATRSPHRPSPIGMTVARVERVDVEQRTVYVSGVDVVDGSPVVDIKPYHPADCIPTARVPQWVTDGSAAGGLDVRVCDHVREEMRRWAAAGRLDLYDDGDEALAAVVECISGDPRTLNAKKKHQHTYGTAYNTPAAVGDRKRDGDGEEEAEPDEVSGDGTTEVGAGAGGGDVIYGVSVDRVDVAFRMLYQAEGLDNTDKEQEKESGGSKKRKKEVAEVFHCQLFEAGQPRLKLRTKEWFARMRQVLAQQQQQHQHTGTPVK